MTVKVFRYTKTSQKTDRTEREKEREVSLETTNERGGVGGGMIGASWPGFKGAEGAETVCNAACGRCVQLEEFVEVRQ